MCYYEIDILDDMSRSKHSQDHLFVSLPGSPEEHGLELAHVCCFRWISS